MPPHPLPNLETQKFYLNEPKFNGVYSRDNSLDKIKDEVYVINLDEYADIGTHYIALYALNNDLTYFESFGIEHIPKEMKRFIGNTKNMQASIFRIQTYGSIMCGYFSIGFIDFMLNGKSITEFTSLLSPNN